MKKAEQLNKIITLLEEIKSELKKECPNECCHDWRYFSDKQICFKCGKVEYPGTTWTYTGPIGTATDLTTTGTIIFGG